mmetsp:Transcript_27159/g.47384  ORF Transcript_27159/g.47384 Transcript_27159/m.47384 type:complete len:148 (+) Transcript_27159:127-570(+)
MDSFANAVKLNSGTAAVGLLAHTFAIKALTTAQFRDKTTGVTKISTAEREKIFKSWYYQRWCAAQLNETEYASVFIAGLLFLHSKGVAAPITSTLCLVGQIWYFWLRALVGHVHEGGTSTPLPPYVPGGVMRYVAFPLLIKGVYDAL